jgi:hypothetical protein
MVLQEQEATENAAAAGLMMNTMILLQGTMRIIYIGLSSVSCGSYH